MTLPDHSVAALVAGRLFSISAMIGLYLGSLLLLSLLIDAQSLKQFWWLVPLYIAVEIAGRLALLPVPVLMLVYLGTLAAILFLQKEAGMHRTWQFWALLLMLVLTALAYFYFTPAIEAMRQSGEAARKTAHFKAMHGTASILYLVSSIAGLALVAVGLPSASSSLRQGR